MKLRVYIEVDVSKTIAETMQRNGFQVCLDGSALQIKIPNTPPIPQRKTNVVFIENPRDTLLCATRSHDAMELLRKLSQCEALSNWNDEIKKVID